LTRKGFEEADYRSDPDVLAQEIVDDLEAALEQFREVAWTWVARWWSPRKADLFR
jgi:ribonuclease HI